MGKIYLTSDLHFGHQKSFLWQPRGFESSDEHDAAVIKNINSVVTDEDELYILGDLMLGDNAAGIEKVKQLRGNKHIILGNHDSESRIELYRPIAAEVVYATMLKYKKYSFFLSHYPTYMGNYDLQMSKVWAIHGHTHYKTKFGEIDKNYNVALDAHNCFPVDLDTILLDIQMKWNEIHKEQVEAGRQNKNFMIY